MVVQLKLDKLETLRLDFDSSRRRYTDLENRLSGTTKPDLATELQNKLSTKDSKVQGQHSSPENLWVVSALYGSVARPILQSC